jgi:hypothetical protein
LDYLAAGPFRRNTPTKPAGGYGWFLAFYVSLAKCFLQLLRPREENLFEVVIELNLEKSRQKAKESKAISDRIEKEIAAGDLKKATDWMKIQDSL